VRPVLLLHGGLANSNYWDFQIEEQAKAFTVRSCTRGAMGRAQSCLVPSVRTRTGDSFEIAGEKFFWKIDYYDRDMMLRSGSANHRLYPTESHRLNESFATRSWVKGGEVPLNDAYSVSQQPAFSWVEFDRGFVGRSCDQEIVGEASHLLTWPSARNRAACYLRWILQRSSVIWSFWLMKPVAVSSALRFSSPWAFQSAIKRKESLPPLMGEK
jgi:hypothetical protein